MDKSPNASKILRFIAERKVITIDALSSLLDSSIKTARRRLKLWKAHTSYNENGRYYTLPSVPEFDANGLWAYRSIRFSLYGNLTQTAIALIRLSEAGLDAAEMSDLLGVSVRSFLSSLQKHTDIRREKVQGRFVYFSSVEQQFIEQRGRRADMVRITKLPEDTDAILVLVETIKNPDLSIEELSATLRARNCVVTPNNIRSLFAYHGLTVKKTPQAPF